MTPTRLVIVLGSLALGGCDSASVQDCEKQLLEKLKAPSTYKRISIRQLTLDAGKPPHYYLVEIEYDAQNSYGALLRDTETCRYRLDAKGFPTMEQFEPYENLQDDAVAAAEAAVENALDAAANSVDEADDAIEASEPKPDEDGYSSEYHEEYDTEYAEPLDANETVQANVAE